MKTNGRISRNPTETRRKLVEAAIRLVLCQGYAATTVDEICDEAGVTKGSFFHHFDSKEAIGQAALDAWGDIGTAIYSPSWSDSSLDPLEQLYKHLDIMSEIAVRPGDSTSCVVGMMSQEMSAMHPGFREVCRGHLNTWNERVTKMLADAKKIHPPKVDFDPESVAWMLNSLWQGSMLVAKTRKSPEMIVSNIEQGRAYIDHLFGRNSEDATQSLAGKEESSLSGPETPAAKPYQVT
jgi:TetR/AcrR family transcriptional regulator, transcriptional repressor for nem operon